MKKYFSIAIAIVMFISLFTVPASASDTKKQQPPLSISEVNGVRTVVTADDTAEYTVIYDAVNDTIQYSERDLRTDIVKSSGAVEIDYSEQSVLRGVISTDTKSGFKYIVTNNYEWELQRPKNNGTSGRYYFKVYANNSNTTQLQTFMSSVHTLSDKEATFKALTTASILSSLGAGFLAGFAVATGGALAPAAITAIVAAVTSVALAQAAGVAVGNQCNACMYNIDAVYLATNNMHF